MKVVKPDVEALFHPIRGILRHQWGVAMLALSNQKPAHVSPPSAVTRRMRVAGLIGFLVVDSMCRNPENRSTLERQRAANGKKILKRQRHLIRPVSVQPMVAHADPEAGTHPVEEQSDGK